MDLDGELIDVARHLSALRLVLFQLALQVNPGVRGLGFQTFRRHFRFCGTDLARYGHARGRCIDDQGTLAVDAGKEDVRASSGHRTISSRRHTGST